MCYFDFHTYGKILQTTYKEKILIMAHCSELSANYQLTAFF